MRWSLFGEIFTMAWDTLRGNKLRSALTVLGVVIGITSIVGMTSLIRGFDQSFRDLIRGIGPDTIFIAKFSGVSLSSGAKLQDLLRRPNVTPDDADAIARLPSIELVDINLGGGGFGAAQQRIYYRDQHTKPLIVFGTTEKFPFVNRLAVEEGRFFTTAEVEHRHKVVVLGQTAFTALFPTEDPIGKVVRVGLEAYEVVGVMAKRPSPGGFNLGQDDFVIVPHTAYQKQFGIRANDVARGQLRSVQLSAVPREGVPREQALREIETTMRIRHSLRLDQPNDFDMVTQDAILQVWDQISQGAFLALIVLSSIALMVGGIGVMSIMTMSVTERTREIGVRVAVGAKRRHILLQFLAEALALSLAGGLLGVTLGLVAAQRLAVRFGWPMLIRPEVIVLAVGFSAAVGIGFGLYPARKASRLDPIMALRYE